MSDEIINQVYQKIEREKVLINAAVNMRQSSNPQVQQSLDAQIKEGRKNIGYLEQRLQELEMRRMGQGMDGMNLSQGSNGEPLQPGQGNMSPPNQRDPYGAPAVPPKSTYPPTYNQSGQRGDYSDQLGAGTGMMPPRPPYGPGPPGSGVPKARPNYSKLGMQRLLFIASAGHLLIRNI